jgi:arylsulfatase A-like enzyme
MMRAVAPCPICTPSRAEILTGVGGMRNGVTGFSMRMNPDLTLIGEAFSAAGYRTGYVGKWHNDGRPRTRGYQQVEGVFRPAGRKLDLTVPRDHHGRPVTGYRNWVFYADDDEIVSEVGVGLTPDISRRFADAAIRFLDDPSDRPFFLHVSFTAPHDPLLMPPGFEGKYDWREIPLPKNYLPEHPFDHGNLKGRDEQLLPWPRTPEDVRRDLAVYYSVISHMDAQLGRILDALAERGQVDRTVVVFTSDHGLAVGSHGLRGKQNMYEHTVGVPLIISAPGLPVGRRVTAQCYLRDIYPTLTELAGVSIPDSVEATSLVPVLKAGDGAFRDQVFGFYADKQRMIRTDRWKLIYYPHLDREQLFDLANDPHEIHDLAGDPAQADRVERLKVALRAWQQRVGDSVPIR